MNLYQLFKKRRKENFIKTVRLIAVKSGWCKILQHKEKKNERTILIKDKNQTPDFLLKLPGLPMRATLRKRWMIFRTKFFQERLQHIVTVFFLERAIVGERLRVAMGLPLRNISEHAPISKGVEASLIEEKYYEPPLINIIKFACNSCPEKRVIVTEGCQAVWNILVRKSVPSRPSTWKMGVCDRSGEMHQMWKVSGILSI